jgi:hypothetical protein
VTLEFAKITLLSLLATIAYGILHDQVTAHLCVEYFTIAHPPLIPTDSPFWLAIAWGIAATWWVGLLLGLLLALVARVGSWPKLSVRRIRRPVLILLIGMAVCALLAGIIGAQRAQRGSVALAEGWGIPPDKQVAFMADAWAHLASYGSGILGGLVLAAWAVARRWRLERITASVPAA